MSTVDAGSPVIIVYTGFFDYETVPTTINL